MAAICEVEVSQRFQQCGGVAMKDHREGHKRSQMMVLTHSFWWCVLPCRSRAAMKDAEPETVLSLNLSKGV